MNKTHNLNDQYQRPKGAAIGIVPLIAVAIASLWLVACGNAFAKQEANQYHASTVQLQLRAGALAITPSDSEAISVTRTVRDPFGRASLDEYVENGTLFIQSECTPRWMPLDRCRVDYGLSVPPTTSITGFSSNGPISITGLSAPITLSTSDGCVSLKDIEGFVDIRARNRPVTLTDVQGNIRIDNEDGAVWIHDVLAPNAIEVSTTNAPIQITNSVGSLILSNRNRRIEVAATAAEQIDAVTTNASITLNPKDAPDRISARSSNGDIEISLPDDSPNYAVETKTRNGASDIRGLVVDPESPFTILAETTNANIEIRVNANERRSEQAGSLVTAGTGLPLPDSEVQCP